MRDAPAFELFGVEITAIDDQVAAQAIVSGEITGCVHFVNAFSMTESTRDAEFMAALQSGTALPDGMPLVWIGRRLGIESLRRRAYGPDVMRRCLDVGRATSVTHFLLGTNDATLQQLRQQIEISWPGATIAGSLAPKFGDFSDSDVNAYASAISASRADLVWVGLSSPRQDLLAVRLAEHADHTLLCVGAAFDFIAGTKKSAPLWTQRLGLEWLHRFVSEPRRLWRRYLIANPKFVSLVVRRRPRLLRA